MKTHACGRHLIDLPQGFEILANSEASLYFGLDEMAPNDLAPGNRLPC